MVVVSLHWYSGVGILVKGKGYYRSGIVGMDVEGYFRHFNINNG